MRINGITGRKPYLTQYLGVDPEEMRICPSVSEHAVTDGDCFLICSDGLSDMLSEEQITAILQSGSDEEVTVQTLIVNALKNGGRDNVTVIVCRIAAE
jgi:protein phosphatase